ncbi:MAG: hypothetical protein AB1428_00325 [Bacteroidota bacterium]
MRTLACILAVIVAIPAAAQESPEPAWQLSPTIALTKYFPGANLNGDTWYVYAPIYSSSVVTPVTTYRYAGTGVNFSVRAYHRDHPNLALTFGAGVTWFYDADRLSHGIAAMHSLMGVGTQLQRNDFTAFPVSIGVQFVYPNEGRESLMFFAGGEGNLHLISGNVSMGEQAKLGYGLVGGFAVKIFEFGVRYTQFSDMRNLGAYLGFRLNPFAL